MHTYRINIPHQQQLQEALKTTKPGMKRTYIIMCATHAHNQEM